MSRAAQQILPGRLEAAYGEERERLIAGGALGKLWSHKPELWKQDADHARVIRNRLGWLGVLDAMQEAAASLEEFVAETRRAGLCHTVLLGMGGSSLAPEVFSLVFPAPPDGRRLFVLDSTDPESLLGIERAIRLRDTLFIAASKSGKTIETLSQFFYFYNRLNLAGVRPPGAHFIAITDQDSYLGRLSKEYNFRKTFWNPADIGGRYSALSYFGLVPAALWGVNVRAVLESAIAMRAACGPEAAAENNPALELGALLGAGAENGADKLVLLATPRAVPLGNWIEQLIAESIGKEGKGILPVAGEVAPGLEVISQGCVVAAIALAGEDGGALDRMVKSLVSRSVPIVRIRLSGPQELGGEFFKWEAATALAGASLRIDPFDEPNVQESKDNTTRILEEFQSSGQIPEGAPRLAEAGIELHADNTARQNISNLNLAEALRTFFAQRRLGDYLALLAYVDRNSNYGRQLDGLRAVLSERLRMPVLLGYGPRYMHSIGQLYKGGPPTGMFLVITAAKSQDVPIPGAKYSFAQLQMAQALGDLESLGRHRKPALRLHLTKGAAAGLEELRKAVEQALATSRPAGMPSA